jgi:hypothetical protein
MLAVILRRIQICVEAMHRVVYQWNTNHSRESVSREQAANKGDQQFTQVEREHTYTYTHTHTHTHTHKKR